MDLVCPKCGEPMDFWEFDDHAARKAFTTGGCASVEWMRDCGGDGTDDRAIAAQAFAEVCGDDVDGIAAMLDDFC